MLKGRGVKYAYCNDKWLVIGATGESGHWTPNLNDVPNPPGTTVGGVGYCTGELTMTVGIARTTFFPLDIVDLPTGVSTNNIHLFDGSTTIGGNTGPITNRDSSKSIGATAYGLPNGAGVGTMVNGIANWVTQNDQGEWSEGVCEVDSCNQHVGQGGGQPHAHGDMFADTHTCLYGTSNYSGGVNAHPPVIGFANDGHLIYGRYLSNSAPGFAAPLLDQCGGHKHDVTTDVDEHGLNLHTNYHYHTQVFDAVCGASDRCTSGVRYTASSTGPLFCYRANLTASEGSAALLGATSRYGATQNQMNYRCCGMTDYYMLNGVPAGVSDASTTFSASSTCTLPAIANGAYETSGSCIVGATMYSGYQCTPTCNAGYAASGKTRCVKGVLVETATCVTPSPATASPSPSPPPPSPSPPPPSPTTAPPPPPSSWPPPPGDLKVVVSFTAAGNPEDFDTTERNALLQAAARAFGFTTGAPPGSTVTITAASVNIQFVFPTDQSTAATIQSTANSFTSPAALQSAIVAQLTTPLAIESTGGGSLAVTSTPTVAVSQTPVVDADASGDPCFPSEALVTMADGTPRRLDALRAGDAIVASRADGTLTTDTVSTLSLADADTQGTTFVVLTTASGRNLALTPTHHVPVGAACCADLKQAKDVAVGETVYEAVSLSAAVSASVRATQVAKIGRATKPGLHSPVLSHGTMPIVNSVATSFDALHNVRLASYGLPLLEATGLTATFRDAFLGAHRKYMA